MEILKSLSRRKAMSTIFDYRDFHMHGVPYDEAIAFFREKIKNHLKDNSNYYSNNIPISLKHYFDSKHSENKMTQELEEVERLTYELLALLDEEEPLVCSDKALTLVGDKDIKYDDGVIGIEIYRLNEDWIRFDYWSYDKKTAASIQAFNFKKSSDRLLHYEVRLYETEQKKEDEMLDFAINVISINED